MTAYEEDLAAIHSAGFIGLAVSAANELLPRLTPGSRVFELGCGDGTTARLLSQAGHRLHGIDLSPVLIERARRNAPQAEFAVGSFVDTPFPAPLDAVIAIGEVLGYILDPGNAPDTLDTVLTGAAAALRPGGLLLFDLAAPGRAPAAGQRGWTEGEGWAVLVDVTQHDDELRASGRDLSRSLIPRNARRSPETRGEPASPGEQLVRRIITFREVEDGRFRRAEEVHRLRLHAPDDVLIRLRAAGFSAEILPEGYAGDRLPEGLIAYLAQKD